MDNAHKSNTQNVKEEEAVQLFAKQMLQSRFFIGNFREKRYVANLQSYRDVISVPNDEVEFIRDLEAVKKRVSGFYPDYWIGITDPDTVGAPCGFCIWTELSDEIFGNYWYKISKVKFRFNEFVLKLKMIRPVTSTTSDSLSKTILAVDKSENVSSAGTDESSILTNNGNILWFFQTVVTVRNTKEAITFLSVLFFTLLTGLIKFVEYLGEFTLKFMRESSHLIHVLTPTIIACINLIAKIIGGFYLLILSMWKTRSPANTAYQSLYIPKSQVDNRNNFNTVYYRRALNAPPNYTKPGVVITPLD